MNIMLVKPVSSSYKDVGRADPGILLPDLSGLVVDQQMRGIILY